MGRKNSEMQVFGKDKKTGKPVIIIKEHGDSEKVVHSVSHKKTKKKKKKHAVLSKKHGQKDGGLEQTKEGRKSKKNKTVETIIVSEDEEQEKAPSSTSKKTKKKKDKPVEAALSSNTSLDGKLKTKRRKTEKDVNAAENGIMKIAQKKMKRKRDKSADTALSTTPVSTNNGSGKSKRSTKKKQGNDVMLLDNDLARSSLKIEGKDAPVVTESSTAHDILHSDSDKPSKSKKARKRKLADVVEIDEVKREVISPKKQKKEEEKLSGTGTDHAGDEYRKSKKKKKHKKQRKSKVADCHSTSDVTGIKDRSKTNKKQKEEDVEGLGSTVRSDSSANVDTKRHKKKKKKSTNSDSSDDRHVSSVEKNGTKSKKAKHDSQKKDSDLLTAAPESSRSKAKEIKRNGKAPSDKCDSTISPEHTPKPDVKSEKKTRKRKHQGMEEIQGKEEKQSSLSEPKVKKEKVMDMDDTEGSIGPPFKQHFEVSSAAASKKKKVKSKEHDKSPSKRKRKSSESWDYSKYTSDKTKLSGSADYKSVGFNYDDTVTVVSVKEGNPDGLGEVEKERRRLLQEEVDTVTGKRGDVQKDGVDIAASATPIMQTGQWSTACLGSSDRQQKFFRLLGGMKSTSGNDNQSSSSKAKSRNSQSPLNFKKSTSESKFSFGSPHSKMAMDKSQESGVNKMLESQFETAMQRKITKGKVSGLGYSEAEDPKTKTFFIDKNASKSVKFED